MAAICASVGFRPFGYSRVSRTQRTLRPVLVRVAALRLTMAACVRGGWPRQFFEMDEERRGAGVVVAAQFAPPAPDRSHGEGSRVVVPPHADPAEIATEIVHAIGDRFPLLGIQEVMDLHLLRLSLRPPHLARILEPPDQFLL